MKFERELTDGRLEYGWDQCLGFFGHVFDERARELLAYDLLCGEYDHARPLRGLLLFISRVSDLFDSDDINECALLLVYTLADELPDHLLPLGEVITNLRIAADTEGRVP